MPHLTLLYTLYFVCSGLLLVQLVHTQDGNHGDNCESIEYCNSTQFLECPIEEELEQRKCRCIGEDPVDSNNGSTLYLGGKCLVKADESSCAENPNCIYHAECLTTLEWTRCICAPWAYDYVPRLGFCWATFGTACNNDGDFERGVCDVQAGLSCRGNESTSICTCSDNDNYEWHLGEKKCMPLVDTSCDIAEDLCPEGAICAATSVGGITICQCDPIQYTSTKEKRCGIRRNSRCDASSTEGLQCNFDEMLSCSESSGRCECDTTSTYSASYDRCLSRVGSSCDPNKFGTTDRICIAESTCEEVNGTSICQCKEGLEPSTDGTTCGADAFLGNSFLVVLGIILFAIVENSADSSL